MIHLVHNKYPIPTDISYCRKRMKGSDKFSNNSKIVTCPECLERLKKKNDKYSYNRNDRGRKK